MEEQVEEVAVPQEQYGEACRMYRDLQTGGWCRSVRWVSVVDSFWCPWPRRLGKLHLDKGVFRRITQPYLELIQRCKCQHKYTETAAQSEQQ